MAITLDDACTRFLRDLQARQLSPSSIRDYSSMLKSLQEYASNKHTTVLIQEIDEKLLREWRETWKLKASTHRLRIQKLRAFFSFAQNCDWIDRSPAMNIRSPKPDSPPTMPLSRSEVAAMLQATERMPKERALLLLLRYSGLAIQDAATLERTALKGCDLILRRAKTGELVTLPLPEPVVTLLQNLDRPGAHFFWTGRGQRTTTAGYWRNRLKLVAKHAGVKNFRPHRLRDTFAVELLIADVSMQDVSVLLGHSSLKTTEKYYAPWDMARRERLRNVVDEANKQDPLILTIYELSGSSTKSSTSQESDEETIANASVQDT